MRKAFPFVLALVFLPVALPAFGGQHDARLDTLFSRLKAVTDPSEALRIEETIWHIWTLSGDERVDGEMGRGIRAMRSGDYAAALQDFDRVVKMAPDFAEGWNKRATVYYLLGDFESSVKDIKRTLALEPRHFGALWGWGLIHRAKGELRAALSVFERAAAIHPLMPGAEAEIRRLRTELRGRAI